MIRLLTTTKLIEDLFPRKLLNVENENLYFAELLRQNLENGNKRRSIYFFIMLQIEPDEKVLKRYNRLERYFMTLVCNVCYEGKTAF